MTTLLTFHNQLTGMCENGSHVPALFEFYHLYTVPYVTFDYVLSK